MEFNVNKKTILAVAAHEDDLDFTCGGSVAKWSDEGANVYYLILTNGSKGFEDTLTSWENLTEIRRKEQAAAGRILGVKEVLFGGFMDGELQNNNEVKYLIVKTIRELKPQIVVSMDPTFVYSKDGFINHPDHRHAGQATLDSVFPYARNARTYPDLIDQGLKPFKVGELLLVNFEGNFVVDITDYFNKKVRALRQHKSQIEDIHGLEEMVAQMSAESAKTLGVKYAESFIRLILPE